jgi:hypothetical protein
MKGGPGKKNKGALDKVSRAYSSKFKHCSKEEVCKKTWWEIRYGAILQTS